VPSAPTLEQDLFIVTKMSTHLSSRWALPLKHQNKEKLIIQCFCLEYPMD
jgi:hypothetical protein